MRRNRIKYRQWQAASDVGISSLIRSSTQSERTYIQCNDNIHLAIHELFDKANGEMSCYPVESLPLNHNVVLVGYAHCVPKSRTSNLPKSKVAEAHNYDVVVFNESNTSTPKFSQAYMICYSGRNILDLTTYEVKYLHPEMKECMYLVGKMVLDERQCSKKKEESGVVLRCPHCTQEQVVHETSGTCGNCNNPINLNRMLHEKLTPETSYHCQQCSKCGAFKWVDKNLISFVCDSCCANIGSSSLFHEEDDVMDVPAWGVT